MEAYIKVSVFSGWSGAIAKVECNRVKAQRLQEALALDKIYLTRLIHVSKGSWQPELYYEGPISHNPGA